MTFSVYGDERLLTQSRAAHAGGAAQDISASVASVNIIQPFARSPGAGSARISVDRGPGAVTR